MRYDTTLAAAVLAALAIAPPAAIALDSKTLVDQAKAQGIVGEQSDGFLGFVKSTDDEALRGAVRDINEGRAALYRQAAARNKVPVEAAGASAFRRAASASRPTTYLPIRLAIGECRRGCASRLI